jgi:BirA family biotin operon repressor/biotin-[acetyl-CoA-carboxylase] ligase
VLLRPDWPVERFTLVTSGLAVSLVDALGSLFETQAVDVEVMVKWPNDVLLVDRETGSLLGKVAGILAELVAGPVAGGPAVVFGMGVNVAWPGPGDPTPPGAVSLVGIGAEVDPSALLDDVLRSLEGHLTVLGSPDGPMALREAHRERSATVGRNVRVQRDGDDLEGRAVDVAVDGALVVEVADGSTVEVLAGDVVHLRTD